MPAIAGISVGTIAAVGSAAMSVGTGIANAVGGSDAAGTAAGQQVQAADQAAQVQREQFEKTQSNLLPWMSAGNSGLTALETVLGIDPASWASGQGVGYSALTKPYEKFAFDGSNFTASPDYQWRLNQGNENLLNNLSRYGGVGGNALKAISDYGQNQAAGEYQNSYGRAYQLWQGNTGAEMNWRNQIYNWLSGVSGAGQNAAANLGGFGARAADSIGSDLIGAGNARAAGTIGQSNALGGGINSLANAGQNYLAYNQSLAASGSPNYGAGLTTWQNPAGIQTMGTI